MPTGRVRWAKQQKVLKSKFSVKGNFLNIATQNTAGQKSSSYQRLLCGGEASFFDPASAAICHFSSLALFSVWSHLSRHSTLGQHSQAGGRTSKEPSSELQTLLLEDFPPAQMCSDLPSAAGWTKEELQLKQLLKDTAKCDCGAFCPLGCLAPCDRFVAPTQTWLRAAPRNTGDLLVVKSEESWTLQVLQMGSWPLKQRWESLTSVSNKTARGESDCLYPSSPWAQSKVKCHVTTCRSFIK